MVYCTGGYSKGRPAIVKMNDNMLGADGKPQMISIIGAPDEYMEGPSIEQLYKDKYYLFFAVYDNGGEAEAYAIAAKITGPYKYKGHVMERNIGEWTIQASVVRWKDHLSFYYHDIPYPSMKRMVCAEYMTIKSDGTIRPVFRTVIGLTN